MGLDTGSRLEACRDKLRRYDDRDSVILLCDAASGPWVKGRRYGTLIVNPDKRQPVDLLPDREVGTVAQWLQDHPGI